MLVLHLEHTLHFCGQRLVSNELATLLIDFGPFFRGFLVNRAKKIEHLENKRVKPIIDFVAQIRHLETFIHDPNLVAVRVLKIVQLLNEALPGYLVQEV